MVGEHSLSSLTKASHISTLRFSETLPSRSSQHRWCPVVNHVIASYISVIRDDAQEGLAGCAVAYCKTLQSREEVGPIALLEILMYERRIYEVQSVYSHWLSLSLASSSSSHHEYLYARKISPFFSLLRVVAKILARVFDFPMTFLSAFSKISQVSVLTLSRASMQMVVCGYTSVS